jgi:hypothetical protein
MSDLITTWDEARRRLVVEPIAAGDVQDVEAEYDIDGIADEVIEWYDAYDAERDVYVLTRQGYRYAPAYDSEAHEANEAVAAFWAVVERYARAE